MRSIVAFATAFALAAPSAFALDLLPALGAFQSNASVNATGYEAGGALLVGGEFDRAAGQARRNLARYAADGTLDPGFHPDPDGEVFQIFVDAAGRRYVSGYFATIGGQPRRGMARFTSGPSPVLDESFDPALPATAIGVEAFARAPDGTWFVSWCASSSQCQISHLSDSGALLPGFSVTTNGAVFPMLVSPAGDALYFSGIASNINGTAWPPARAGFARVSTAGGALDTAFVPFTAGSGRLRSIVQDGPGHLVVGGTIPGGTEGLARIDLVAGTADVGFGPDLGPATNVVVHNLFRLPNGDLFVAGDFGTADGVPHPGRVMRLAPDGSVVAGWGDSAPTGGTTTNTSAVSPAGDVALVRFASPLFAETTVLQLAAADGAPSGVFDDARFSFRATFTRVMRQPGTTRILAGGPALREVDGRASHGVIALTDALQPDATWTSGLAAQVGLGGTLHLAAGPTSVFTGSFAFAADGSRTRGLWRLDGNDGSASAWVPAADASVGVSADAPSSVAVDEAGGFVYTANLNNNANGQPLPGRPFVRFALADGFADGGWTPTITGSAANSGMLFDDGFVYLGGFTSATASDNSTVASLARFDVDGTGRADPSFKPFAGAAAVRTLAVDATWLYAGGVNLLVRIDKATGVVDTGWSPLRGTFGTVTGITPEADGSVMVTGSLAAGCGSAVVGIARVLPGGAIDPRWKIDVDQPANAALALDGGRVLVGGAFRSANGEDRDGLAAFGPSPTIFVDSAGDPGCVR